MTWALAGQVGHRPAAVARPQTDEEVAAVLAVCHEETIPVTAAAGRSGVCGGSVPVHGGVLLDLCGLSGIRSVDPTSMVLDVQAGTFGDRLEDDAAGRARGDPRPLAAVHRPVDRRRLAGLSLRRPALQPVRQDRGHGHRPRRRSGRRPGDPHRRRPPGGRRARPQPGLHRLRGHPGRDPRRPPPSPHPARGRAAGGLRLRVVRRRQRRLSPHPAARGSTRRAAGVRRHRGRAQLSDRRAPRAVGARRG